MARVMAGDVLCLNAGSSSLKFALFEPARAGARTAGAESEPPATEDLRRVLSGEIDRIGTEEPHLRAIDAEGRTVEERRWQDASALEAGAFLGDLLAVIEKHRGSEGIGAAGHRVVHGGPVFTAPVLVDERVLAELDRLTPWAPLHQPQNLAAIRALAAVRPALPQVACFDTAFHSGMPPVARRFALPRELEEQGIRRYGFHGLSYEYIARTLARMAPRIAAGRVIVAHLGNGASLCALRAGQSVATTMGFTALDGVPMGTRSGAVDPGVLLYLLQQQHLTPVALEDLLYRRSGLLGVSGVSSDMRTLLASHDSRAAEAVELFVFRIVQEIGALAATLGGLDALVFTAGIGEHAAEIRRRVCEGASWLGLELDPEANASGGPLIARGASRLAAYVIPTDEDLMIALHTRSALRAAADR